MLEAGVRDHGVEPAETLDGRVDGRAVPLARRQVGGEGVSRPVRVGSEVDGQHLPAVADEPPCDRPPDPAGRAGDERNLAHGPPRT